MNMDIYSATPPVAKKRRSYSKEFKLSIVNACKNPNTSIASVALQHSINANLVSRWIRIFSHHEGAVQDPTHVNPAFIALPYTAAISQPIDERITLCITVPHTNNDIQLKWQTSEIPALAELLKALAT
ncbi:transposase [Acinetobacter towneri]|uniref:transposase n=1 Tax=Acinetobacter TaxID=469 RepID=UPI00119769C1|nr:MULTISPECIES: transposase [Acinetobacter]MCA4780603.1 transposase [Acinetobacter towneri]MCA4785931.1 transposase [Acinetobacter towneri]MCA4788591.1 transposase [Acinetobacter towneri]MCA4797073.1 transposase [Acinetobacter towneri]MCA4802164.1 transposase [Acinetobacter towneri]